MKKITWITVIIIGSVLGSLSFCEYAENPRSSFSNYNDAKSSGMMDAGWIPTYIPLSSTDIKETHNIDTNTVKMTFKYSPHDTKDIEKNCITEETSRNIVRYKCSYFGNDVYIALHSDGSGKLESHRK
jgi:hypothetical protein